MGHLAIGYTKCTKYPKMGHLGNNILPKDGTSR